MILIADSGSTNTTWCIAENGICTKQIISSGINPFFQTKEEIADVIKEFLLPEINNFQIESLFFYGAGCASTDKHQMVTEIIYPLLPVEIEVGSDLLGAARGLCGKQPGVACILGTGSNSCYYDGSVIIKNISPLGYVLGDEGSGAVLGKILVSDCLKNQLPQHIIEKFLHTYSLTPALLLERIYKQAFPNRYLASFTHFLHENVNEPAIYELVYNSFHSFFIRNVMQYEGHTQYPIHFAGSVAHHFKNILTDVADSLHLRIGKIEQSPVNGLLSYHSGVSGS